VADFLGIIPARYASTRFPGKALALLDNKPIVQWVYERISPLLDHLLVATDDVRIKNAVDSFGGSAIMTSPDHGNGTERCFEAYRIYRERTGVDFTHVINIQGDQPMIRKEQLNILMECAARDGVRIATLIKPLADIKDLENPNVVKVVVDNNFRALYFSRTPIPFRRDPDKDILEQGVTYYGHIGLYAFRSRILEQVVQLQSTPLERAESLEQLRWLESGFPIQTKISHYTAVSVDTPEDLEKISSLL